MEKVRIGIIGCGFISGIYLKNLTQVFKSTQVVACADQVLDHAVARAAEFGIPKACTVEELLSDPAVDIVVNLTTPAAHTEVNLASLRAGKHVYAEKPLAITRDEGMKVLELARDKGLLVGSAPDTFLGGGLQTCRKLIDDGLIGQPVAATAFMVCHGHESWHPAPEFYYQRGGGPMFDMGPYYLTALISLLGPVKRVTGSARITFPERTITSQPQNGKIIQVEVPTHVTGVLDFESGAVATLITSFDVWHANLPCIELYGSKGSMMVPDPNTFGGPILLREHGDSQWRVIPTAFGYNDNSRGLGVADMAAAIRSGRKHRASGEMAYHVLDMMHGFHESSDQGRHIVPASTCTQPAPLPIGLAHGETDL